MNTYVSYKDKLPVLTHKLADAIQDADDKTRIAFFHGDKLVFCIWKDKVVKMIANNTMVGFVQRRCNATGINYEDVVAK